MLVLLSAELSICVRRRRRFTVSKFAAEIPHHTNQRIGLNVRRAVFYSLRTHGSALDCVYMRFNAFTYMYVFLNDVYTVYTCECVTRYMAVSVWAFGAEMTFEAMCRVCRHSICRHSICRHLRTLATHFFRNEYLLYIYLAGKICCKMPWCRAREMSAIARSPSRLRNDIIFIVCTKNRTAIHKSNEGRGAVSKLASPTNLLNSIAMWVESTQVFLRIALS